MLFLLFYACDHGGFERVFCMLKPGWQNVLVVPSKDTRFFLLSLLERRVMARKDFAQDAWPMIATIRASLEELRHPLN